MVILKGYLLYRYVPRVARGYALHFA